MLYVATTFKLVFDYQPSDVYWCTADIGWITGHSYITYGPLANGATSVLVSGHPVRGRAPWLELLTADRMKSQVQIPSCSVCCFG